DVVYLIPPRHNLLIQNNVLYLTRPDNKSNRHLNLPIDIFFKSLAEERQDKAIAIILSGTGSDGARGIRAIKENEGMVMVQHKESAKFDGMPASAIATGIVDYILPAEKMGKKLLNYIEHPYLKENKNLTKKSSKEESELIKILNLIKNNIGIDFNRYKEKTVIRRIERRMIINQIQGLDNYLDYLYNY
ncbi:MAG: chemotaxis protein CheB, partial [Halanaerobiales bacterium]